MTQGRVARLPRVAGIAGGGAALILVVGIAAGVERAWAGWLLAAIGMTTLGLAGLIFIAIQYAAGACWAVALRRIPEAMTAAIPVGGLAVLGLLILRPEPYPWFHGIESHGGNAAFKAAWLSWPFLIARSVVYLVAWVALARALVMRSRRQDTDGAPAHTHSNTRTSIAGIIVIAVTLSLASFDWIMSIEPEWYSTIFGIYQFAGLFSSGLAVITMLVVWLRRGPMSAVVTDDHLHDLGKLLFAFCTFWMYIWFSQYMLIWYANLPEETGYYVTRMQGLWGPLFLLNMLLNWAIPFALLLRRSPKRRPEILVKIAFVILAGRCFDLYLLIVPPIAWRTGGTPPFGLWEIAAFVALVGGSTWVIGRALQQAPLVPARDPGLALSLRYHS